MQLLYSCWDSHGFPNWVSLSNSSLCQVPKTFSPLRFALGEAEGKPGRLRALTRRGYWGAAPAESITGTMAGCIKRYSGSSVVIYCYESALLVLVTVPVVTCHYRLIRAKSPFCQTARQTLAATPGPAGLTRSILPGPAPSSLPTTRCSARAAGRQRAGE